ncbi:DUF488 domain-containing protein [Nodularia spumigena CS-584]|jgi:uncharacterized protein (DUF488 family)|uniref:DUF488 domain-containing protein n=3 Tax=Nodularia spumigena TaxID=70799 RepID=A0A166HYV3_NODSP|nr:DUF488 domain-containing protein [Nodularia spumigena]AHJ30712.1 hypothetical protein NSP_44150 [Nodularia spumigena CCY9414]EAW45117.1 hypothetical protein N9414_02816 [Nodularia spumigena CCY9414]KZL47628.1 hypothetical protein A2T98_22125 [Nodularia spumigena CENA596]MDB9322020.1 DUF488 domain-containing protein [Nodularia spumigena CS-591/07A]MDB9331564.1 DUF488 domain-containing protein [Nodularia spumigena CS-591/04]
MSEQVNLFTIGFTQKKAEQFFETLIKAGVKRVIDTRLNNVSQLAGFAKKNDLEYFLRKIGEIEYIHILDLAPTKDILEEYKKKQINWALYEKRFNQLITERQIEKKVNSDLLDEACLLCSEAKPHNCHRRLVAEYLQNKLNTPIKIHHL